MFKKKQGTKKPSPVMKMRPYLARKKAPLIGSITMSALASAFGLVPYLVVYMLCIRILQPAQNSGYTDFIILALIALAAVLLKGLCFMLSANLAHKAAYDIIYEIRIEMADKLTKLPLGFFDRNDAGSLKHTMNEEVENLEEGIAHLIPDVTSGIAIPLLTFGAMLAMDWRLALAAFAILPILSAAFSYANSKIKALTPRFVEVNSMISSAMLRYVHGMKVIRAFSRSDSAYAEYCELMQKAGEIGEEVEGKSVLGKSLAAGLAQMSLLIVVPVGVWLYVTGNIELPMFILFIMLTVGVGNTLMKAFRSSGQISFRIAGAARKVITLLEQQELAEPKQPIKPTGADIEFDRVSFSYGGKKDALQNVSFTVQEGTLTALVGASGAGKTTIARMVPRFWDVTEGSVKIGGADVREIGSEGLLNLVSYVFQDVYLFDGTIMDNIRMGRSAATDEEVMEAARQARCHDFIVSLPDGYQTIVGEGGSKLSGGQKQRISIVRAFLKQAPIVVLDEATALIDPENEARIQDAVNELMNPVDGKPKTILMIAHRLHTVVHADQIVVVDNGTIVACGKHNELLATHEGYRKQWEAYNRDSSENKALLAAQKIDFDEQMVSSQQVFEPAVIVSENSGVAGAYSEHEQPDRYRQLNELSLVRKTFVLAEPEQDRKRLIKSYWLTLLEGVVISVPAIVIAAIIYTLFNENYNMAWQLTGVMVFVFLLQELAYYQTNRVLFPFYPKLMTNIRVYLGRRLKDLPFGFFSKYDAASIEMRIKQDVFMTSLLPNVAAAVIKGCVIPCITLIALLWIDWPLALVAAAGVPLCFLVSFAADRKFKGVLNRLQKARSETNRTIIDFIRGIAVIRAFGLARSSLIGYKHAMEEYRDSSIATNNKYSPYTALNAIMFELGFSAVLLVGGWRLMEGSIDGISFLCFIMLTAALYEPLPILDYIAMRRMMHTTLSNLDEIIQEDDLQQPVIGHEKLPQGQDIVFENVVFGYGKQPVLKNFNLHIPAKGMTALVGPSGGGKTTALNLIARFWDAEQGEISIGKASVKDMRHDTLMRQVSFVFQDVYLLPGTILHNLKYGRPDATFDEVIEAAKAARCHEFIMELPDGYNTEVSEGGSTLSGGQKQRISIARAILKDAPIVLLDEATASVDPENEQYISEALQALAANKTVVMVAHRLHTIQNATKIAVVEDGCVVQTGTHDELMKVDGLYRKFWEERTRAEQWQVKKESKQESHILS